MKKWTLISKDVPKGNENTEKFNIKKEVAQIMINRGISETSDIEMFLNPSFKFLRDPFLLKDMDKAVSRIKLAIENNQKICIYGDYDVDGVSSTSLMILYFKHIDYPVEYYIPNRLNEGYGLNCDAIDKIKSMGVDLIVTVDCGITSVNEVDYANKLGIDVVVTDHHECQLEIPNAVAVVDPKREDCEYPFKGLCGCGVAFKLIHALSGTEDFLANINRYIEIVSLATICDIMPVLDENRIIVKNGLEKIGRGENIGMKALFDVCELGDVKTKSSHLGFSLGPRINASGRLGFSRLGVELFTCEDKAKAEEIAQTMNFKNEERQLIESKIYNEAEAIISSDSRYEKDKVIVIASEGWHHGIIGIVASKLTEKYYRPCILLCLEDGITVGSARSIKGFDIFSALLSCKKYLAKFGGHEQAAGLSVEEKNIDILRDEINRIADFELVKEDLIEEIKIEFEVDENSVNLDLVNELHLLEPFGIKNRTPYFLLRNCYVKNVFLLGRYKNHLKITVEKGVEFDCIGFGMAHLREKFDVDDMVDIVCLIDENTFNGRTKVQLMLKDIRLSRTDNLHRINEFDAKFFELVGYDRIDRLEDNNLNDTDSCDLNNSIDQYVIQEVIGNYANKKHSRINSIYSTFDSNTLIIVNTPYGYFRAKSDVNISDIDNLNILFASNIDKINLKVYNKIIMYDYFDNEDVLKYIYSNKSENTELIYNINELDFEYIKNIFNSLEFNRDSFVKLYKYISSQAEGSIEIMQLSSILGIKPIEIVKILKVLESENLILLNFEKIDNSFYFKVLPKPEKKLNLEENKLILNINNLINRFRYFYNL